MKSILKFTHSISVILQVSTIFLSVVGVAFGIKNYHHVRTAFGIDQSVNFLGDIWSQIIVAIVINIVVGLLIYIHITEPIKNLTDKMSKLAEGNFSEEVPYTALGNEIGDIARTVKVFREYGIRMKQMEMDQVGQKAEAERLKRQTLNQMADSFEGTVRGVVAQVASSASKMQSGAEEVSGIAEDTKVRTTVVAKASETAAKTSAEVAAAADQLMASISQISMQTQKSSQIAKEATSKAEFAKGTITMLSEKSLRVGQIIEVITQIAGQINLLALNATIESARAGEAGKGFAVVASEVKNLASQVAKATSEITQQIKEMQGATQNSVDSVLDIIGIITLVSDNAVTVASAVEEQSAVTNEIARNVARTSTGTKQISENIQSVQDGAKKTGDTASQVLLSAYDLNQQSNSLKEKVDDFLKMIRGAA